MDKLLLIFDKLFLDVVPLSRKQYVSVQAGVVQPFTPHSVSKFASHFCLTSSPKDVSHVSFYTYLRRDLSLFVIHAVNSTQTNICKFTYKSLFFYHKPRLCYSEQSNIK